MPIPCARLLFFKNISSVDRESRSSSVSAMATDIDSSAGLFSGFPQNLLGSVVCQNDQAPLASSDDSPLIIDGAAECPACRARYKITAGILDLLSVQQPIDEVSAQEVVARDADAPAYDARFSSVRNKTELPSTLAGLDLSQKAVLELGCGTGRVTTLLQKDASSVIAADFSRESLRILSRKLQGVTNVALLLADAAQLRLPAERFDLVISTQLLEHVSFADRQKIFAQVERSLKPGGAFVFTVYHHSLLRRLKRAPRDGFHASQIRFHYFTASELRHEVSQHFSVRDLHPIQIPAPLRRVGVPAGWLSRKLERVPLLSSLGSLLKVDARKSIARV